MIQFKFAPRLERKLPHAKRNSNKMEITVKQEHLDFPQAVLAAGALEAGGG